MSVGAEGERESPLKLTEKAYRLLEEMIVTLQFAPGSTWSETTICERIGIGRTPVREALQRLALDQLVEIVPRYGVVVTEILVPEQIMVVEMRRAIDPLIAARAARRSSPRERARINEYRRKMMDTAVNGEIEEYLRLHQAVRGFVASCTRNKFLAGSLGPIDALSRRFFFAYQAERESLTKTVALQSVVLEAIASDNELEAAAAANRLVDYVEEFTRAALDDQY